MDRHGYMGEKIIITKSNGEFTFSWESHAMNQSWFLCWSESSEDLISLLGHTDECCALWELLQFSCSCVSAGWSQSSKNVKNGGCHISFVWYFYRLSLTGPKKVQNNICQWNIWIIILLLLDKHPQLVLVTQVSFVNISYTIHHL